MLQASPHVIHFKSILDFGEGQGFPFGRILEPPCVNAQRRYRRLVEMPFGTPSLDAKLLSLSAYYFYLHSRVSIVDCSPNQFSYRSACLFTLFLQPLHLSR
jgi:hypothetical protein